LWVSRTIGHPSTDKNCKFAQKNQSPDIGEAGYEEAKEFVNKTCWGEEVKLDVDDKKQYDPHYRILAVVYVNDTNLNEKLVKEGYAEVMYIPPSEFDSCEW
jgi:micrococcal nuclease